MSRLALFNSMPAIWESLIGRSALSRRPRSRPISFAFAYLFSFVVFAVDCLLPSSGTLAMLYVLPIIVMLGTRRQDSLIQVCLLCVLLTVVGYFLGKPTGLMSDELIQRGASLITMGLLAWIGWQLVESADAAEQFRIDSCLRQVAEEAATFFRSMVDHVPIGISRTDLEGQFIYVNDEFCKMFDT